MGDESLPVYLAQELSNTLESSLINVLFHLYSAQGYIDTKPTAAIKHMLSDARCHLLASQKATSVDLSIRTRTASSLERSLGADYSLISLDPMDQRRWIETRNNYK